VAILTICCQIQILKKVVRVCLAEIGSIHFESHEHDTSPGRNAKVHLSNQSIFFDPGPSRQGIEPMNIFPFKSDLFTISDKLGNSPIVWRLVLLCSVGIIEDTGL
jgi:hypothetical protein